MKVAFEALLKKYTPIALVSGDKQLEISLQLNDSNVTKEVLYALADFYDKTPKRVMIVMMDDPVNNSKKTDE